MKKKKRMICQIVNSGKVKTMLEKAKQKSGRAQTAKLHWSLLYRDMKKQLHVMECRMKKLQAENEVLKLENMLWKVTVENEKTV